MASIPKPIRKWIRRWVTGVGSDEVASQAPVKSVDGETGEVTISVPVDQVNGQTGDVTLTASDVNALADTYSAPVQSVNSQTGDVTVTAPVDSVNGETGTVSLSASDVGALGSSSDVDHQQTTNRTHDGDDLSPATLEAADEFVPPVVATEADLPDPANVPEGAETTVLNDPNGETSVYKVVDN